jgi:hypothetical protein
MVRNAADTPNVMGFAHELTGWLNKRYNVNIRVGTELFGNLRIHWMLEAKTLAELHELNGRMAKDREYWSYLEKGRDFWVPGSMQDSVVDFIE